MTIESTILGYSPTLYWKLDDATGPAASDDTGNGNAGVYGGSFSLRQGGVSGGSFCVQLGGGGQVSISPSPVAGDHDHTYMFFASEPLSTGGTLMTLATNGNGTGRGTGILQTYAGTTYARRWRSGGQTDSTGLATPGWLQWWHHYALVYQASTGTATIYVDGSAGAGPAVNTSAMGAGTDVFAIQAPIGGVVQHAALWNSMLSGANIAAIAANIRTWPYGPLPEYLPVPG